MTCPDEVEDRTTGERVAGAEVSFDEHERLALELLAVEAGDIADVKEAMRKIIASAPDGANVALLLSRALSRARDRAPDSQPPKPATGRTEGPRPRRRSCSAGPENHRLLLLRWLAAATPFVGAAALAWSFGDHALQIPVEGADGAAVTAMSAFAISVGSLGIALIGVETSFLRRWAARRPVVHPAAGSVRAPGWYNDPWGRAPSRWWNGSIWTGRTSYRLTRL